MRSHNGMAQYNSLKGGAGGKNNHLLAGDQYAITHAPRPQPVYSSTFPKCQGSNRVQAVAKQKPMKEFEGSQQEKGIAASNGGTGELPLQVSPFDRSQIASINPKQQRSTE